MLVFTDREAHKTEQAYDQRGLPHTIRDVCGGYKHMAWNSRAQLIAYTDCSGKTTRFAYDARGALASVTDAMANATTYRTDALGRVTEIVDPEGGVQKLRYDPLGRLAAITDAAEHTMRNERNLRGLPLRRIDALGHTVAIAYNSAQRLVSLTNENGESYRFGYDRNDNLVEEIGLDGTVKRIEYDARGLPVKVTDAADTTEALTLHRLAMKHSRGRITLYRYDQLGQLLQAEILRKELAVGIHGVAARAVDNQRTNMRHYATIKELINDEENLDWQATLFVNHNDWDQQPEAVSFLYLEGDAEIEDDIVDEETLLPRLAQENDTERFLDVELFKAILKTQRELHPNSTVRDYIRALKYYLEYDTFYPKN